MLRRVNATVVLDALRDTEALNAADLVAVTSLPRPTVNAVVDGPRQPGDSPSSARTARRPNRRALAAGDAASRSAPITDMWLASTSRVQSARSSRRPAVADAVGRGLDAPVPVDNEGPRPRCATSERLQAAPTRARLGRGGDAFADPQLTIAIGAEG